MKFGCCSSLDKAKMLKSAGFDYIELGVSTDLIPLDSASPVSAIKYVLDTVALPVDAFNMLVPGSLKIVGPDRDFASLLAYMKVTCLRASELGATVLVFGSGAARNVPSDFDQGLALEQIVEFLREVAGTASEHGLTIAIEPLQKAECNVINSVSEGVAVATKVDQPNTIAVLSDLYHVWSDHQPLVETAAAGTLLHHVHVACGADRHPPVAADFELLKSFFEAVKLAGYDSRVSIEANWKNLDADAESALHILKSAWVAA